MKNDPESWPTWAFVLFLITLFGAVAAIIAFGGQWFASISAISLPIAMTTGKHDLPPLSKGQIVFGVIIAVLIIIIAFITPPLP